MQPKPDFPPSRDESAIYTCEREDAFSASCERLGIGTALLTLDGKWLMVNRQLCEMVGYSREELLAKSFDDLFHSSGSHSDDENRKRLLACRLNSYRSDKSVTRKDGRGIWVRAVVTLVRDEMKNAPRGFLVVIEEITPLKQAEQALKNSEKLRDELSRRMMNAQDADRTRIARELHDDIGQALAVLKIQLLRLGRPLLAGGPSKAADLSELAAEVQAIAQKVSHLSHELHSSELEFFGLAIAIESHCREFSKRFHVQVECSCYGIRKDLCGALPLAFLRVVQEALHNVVKHSKASRVKVHLSATANELTLTVSDDGVGFEVERQRRSSGLGLISMRERMHLVGGGFEIRSKPGEGAKIVARAPLAKARPNRIAPPYASAKISSSVRSVRLAG